MTRFIILCFVTLLSRYGDIFGLPVDDARTDHPPRLAIFLTLYEEIFSIASGAHIFSPSYFLEFSSVEDRELQEIAIASTNIWLKLPYTEKLNAVFINSSNSTMAKIIDSLTGKESFKTIEKDRKKMTEIWKELFETIEKTILANDLLAPMYRREKAEA